MRGGRGLLAVLIGAAACGGGEWREEPWTVGIVDRPPTAAGVAQVVGVRAARHDGHDRVVWEFAGAGLPGVHLEYVDRPVHHCGSGAPVPMAGDGWLEVRFEPAGAHDEAGRPSAGERERLPALPVVLEIERTCDFEAVATWVLGVARPTPYRVLALDDPPRIAVDVRH